MIDYPNLGVYLLLLDHRRRNVCRCLFFITKNTAYLSVFVPPLSQNVYWPLTVLLEAAGGFEPCAAIVSIIFVASMAIAA